MIRDRVSRLLGVATPALRRLTRAIEQPRVLERRKAVGGKALFSEGKVLSSSFRAKRVMPASWLTAAKRSELSIDSGEINHTKLSGTGILTIRG